MRQYKLDGHVHSIASGHAYSTLNEIVDAARARGISTVCMLEHGKALLGGVNDYYFANTRVMPSVINGVRLLQGIEANILDIDGNLDIPEAGLSSIEVVGASLHPPVIAPKSKMADTEALLNVMENPMVDYLCHIGNPQYELDYEAVLQMAKKKDKLIEINNASFAVRPGSSKNCVMVAKRCAELDIPMILGTDAHYAGDVGYFPYADYALNMAGVPDELIINLEPNRLLDRLLKKNRPIYSDFRKDFSEVFNFEV